MASKLVTLRLPHLLRMLLWLLLLLLLPAAVLSFPSLRKLPVARSSKNSKLLAELQFSSLALAVPDAEKYTSYYRHLLGVTGSPCTVDVAPGATIQVQRWEPTPAEDEFKPEAFGGLGVLRRSAEETVAKALSQGGTLITPCGDYSYGASIIPDEDEKKLYPVRYARLGDPWGMSLEVVEEATVQEEASFAKIVLKVLDLDESVQFYSNALNLQQLRRRSNVNNRPREASMMARMGTAGEQEGVVLELVYDYATEALDLGGAYRHMTWTCPSLRAVERRWTAAAIPFSVVGHGLETTDPAGYKIRIEQGAGPPAAAAKG